VKSGKDEVRWDIGPRIGGMYQVMKPDREPFVSQTVAWVVTLEDARLIAAAPELLAALQTIITSAIGEPIRSLDEIPTLAAEANACLDRARAVIAKATGALTYETVT